MQTAYSSIVDLAVCYCNKFNAMLVRGHLLRMTVAHAGGFPEASTARWPAPLLQRDLGQRRLHCLKMPQHAPCYIYTVQPAHGHRHGTRLGPKNREDATALSASYWLVRLVMERHIALLCEQFSHDEAGLVRDTCSTITHDWRESDTVLLASAQASDCLNLLRSISSGAGHLSHPSGRHPNRARC
jgi:hypothetical protein